jgi:hypothetical protein
VVKTILLLVVLLTVPVMSAPKQAVLGVFVTDAAGAPIAKATVYFPDRPYTNVGAVTSRDGLAHFGEIRTGTYRLCAMAQDYAEHCADVAHVDAKAKTIVLTRTGR